MTVEPAELRLAPGETGLVDVEARARMIEYSFDDAARMKHPSAAWTISGWTNTLWISDYYLGEGNITSSLDYEGVSERCQSPDEDDSRFTCPFEVTAGRTVGGFDLEITVTGSGHSFPETAATENVRVIVGEPQTTTSSTVPPTTIGCPQSALAPTETASASGDTALDSEVVVATAPGAEGTYAAGTTTVRIEGAGAVFVAHRHPDAIWTPCTDGPISSIRFDMTGTVSAGDNGAVVMRPVVIQNGSVFGAGQWSLRAVDGTSSSTWEVAEGDFSRISGTATLDLASGPPIGFGYTVAISCPQDSDCSTAERSFTLGQFSMQIEPG